MKGHGNGDKKDHKKSRNEENSEKNHQKKGHDKEEKITTFLRPLVRDGVAALKLEL
jgi:hypothetical protein